MAERSVVVALSGGDGHSLLTTCLTSVSYCATFIAYSGSYVKFHSDHARTRPNDTTQEAFACTWRPKLQLSTACASTPWRPRPRSRPSPSISRATWIWSTPAMRELERGRRTEVGRAC